MHWQLVIGILVTLGIGLLILGLFSKGDSYSDVSFGVSLTGACLAFVFGLVGLAIWMTEVECERIGIQVERDTEFFAVGGCFVTLENGRSVPIDENSIGLFLEDR